SSGQKADAALVGAMASTAHAVWITGGSPNDARVAALKTVNRAAGKNQLPTLALYDIPGRDCSGYSAGGATDLASYEAWIDGDALSPYLVWQDVPYSGQHADLAWNTVGIDSRWASMLGSVQPAMHFVVDTSRDGRGPWQTTVAYPDKQDWCNPPGRGLGPPPT